MEDSGPLATGVADLNGDGKPDVVDIGTDYGVVFFGFERGPLLFGTGDSLAAAFTLNLHHQSPLAGKPDRVAVDSSGIIYTLINETK